MRATSRVRNLFVIAEKNLDVVCSTTMAMRGAALFDLLEATPDERRFLDLTSRGTALNIEEETGFMLWTVNEDHDIIIIIILLLTYVVAGTEHCGAVLQTLRTGFRTRRRL